MPRRYLENNSEDDPPKKRNCTSPGLSSINLKQGELLRDVVGKQWRLGKSVGVGGFGEIYLASDNLTKEVNSDCRYVAKVENHKNGPLFVEMNCYLRIARQAMIDDWKAQKKISSLGMPHYVASGSHMHKREKYRFLILPKFDKDLERILQEKKMFNLKTVLTISLQIIDVLEYIHSKGYIHSDIKASNILLLEKTITQNKPVCNLDDTSLYILRTCTIPKEKKWRRMRNLRPQTHVTYLDDIPNFEDLIAENERSFEIDAKPNTKKDQVYLLDYGLACKFLTSEGSHKPFCVDERKAHAGTISFCSRDAHKGVSSRRSDLESLGYNLIYWLSGELPWTNDEDPELVERKKIKAMSDIVNFLKFYYPNYPKFLEDYFKYLQKLQFEEKPDYAYCRSIFLQSLKSNGFKNDSCFDFDNSQLSKIKIGMRKVAYNISRSPLKSNVPRPLLRKKVKNKKNLANWFEGVADPEIILKQGRQRGNEETTSIADLNLNSLNPTYAMIEIYNKCCSKNDHKLDSSLDELDGYTHAMKLVALKMKKQKLESEKQAVITRRSKSSRRKKSESPKKTGIVVIKKINLHTKKKNGVMRRSYSLRG